MEEVVVPETCCLVPKEKKAKTTSCVYVQQVETPPAPPPPPQSSAAAAAAASNSSPESQNHHQTAAVATSGVSSTSFPDPIIMPPVSAAKDNIVEGADGQEARQKMDELSLVVDISQESVISDGDNIEKDADQNKSLTMMMGTEDNDDDCIQVSDMISSDNAAAAAAAKASEISAVSSTEKTPDERLRNKCEDTMDWESQQGSPILSNVQTAASRGVIEEANTLDGTRVLVSSAQANQSSDDLQSEQEGNHSKQQGSNRNSKRTHHSLNSSETELRHKIPPESEVGHDQPPDPVQRSASKMKTVPVDSMAHCVPKNSKDLMATGYLEGQHVRYVARGRVLLTGIIQDGGVICDCSKCKGIQMITISMFEKHAGSTAHHPSDYILLRNGNSLRKIVDNCQHAAHCRQNVLDSLKRAIGYVPTNNRTSNNPAAAACHKCGLPYGAPLLSCSQTKCSYMYHPECIGTSSVPRGGNWVCPMCEKMMKKPSPIVATKRKNAAAAEEQPLQISTRPSTAPASTTELHQRTTRYKEQPTVVRTSREDNLNVHKALFQPGGLPDGTELGYYVKSQCVRRGVKRAGGICCSCCNTVISCSAFEQHAGFDSRRSPYGSILLQDGHSLHETALKLAGKENSTGNKACSATRAEKFDYCYECGDSGDLLWCHSCSDPYHLECAGVSRASESEWYCGGCLKSSIAVTKSGRRVSTKPRADLGSKSSFINKDGVTGTPTTLFLETSDSVGGCVFCKSWEFSKSGFDARTMLLCDQCEQEYHVGCLKEHGLEDLKELPHGEWFCKQDCRAINNILALLVANGPESLFDSVISKFLESRQQRQGSVDDQAEPSSPSFEWQILHGRGGNSANGRTLAEAVDIFSECFGSIKDATTGRSLIPLMVHSRSMKDHNFEGIFCVVLKRNDKVVSTALFRIFGRHLAEVPLVATSLAHQGQGHCKALMLTIERLLGVMSVEQLILPAAKGKESLWVDKFGFTQMNGLQLKKLQMETQIMVFSGLSMLEKAITPMAIC